MLTYEQAREMIDYAVIARNLNMPAHVLFRRQLDTELGNLTIRISNLWNYAGSGDRQVLHMFMNGEGRALC